MQSRLTKIPESLNGGPFTVAEGRLHGVSTSRLRAHDLGRPIRGVRLPPECDDLVSRCRAFALHRAEPYAFSHTTAALLLGVPLPRSWEHSTELHVTVPAPGRAPVARGYRGHKTSDWRPVELDGIPITPPDQTWTDLGTLLPRDALIAAGDFLVSGRAPSSSCDELAAAVGKLATRRGVTRLREALPLVRAGVESPQETRLRLVLIAHGLPEPAINYTVLGRHGEFVARVDLAYPEHRLAIEYEGDVHRLNLRVFRNDIARREQVEDLAWRMIRVTGDDLHPPADSHLVARVRRAFRTTRWARA
jgi:hypothetical protein